MQRDVALFERWATGSWRATSSHTLSTRDRFGVDVLVVAQAMEVRRRERLDHEHAVVREVRGDVLEAANLALLVSRLKNVL